MKNQDQPAYPVENLKEFDATGLTKRELLAAMAMQGLIASNFYDRYTAKCGTEYPAVMCASAIAYEYADAMLAELDKENVCEWKWDTEAKVYRLDGRACTTNWTNCSPINFCPYCVRKIKEVK